MLFNSYLFLVAFLPAVLVGHRLVRQRVGIRASWAWLVAASLVFYGWWYPPYLVLLLASVGFNGVVGRAIHPDRGGPRKLWLTIGVSANLAALGWFKYAGFLEENIQAIFGVDLGLPSFALPLAISFFTFQQIAYLVDSYRGKTKDHGWLEYLFFVTFFPQLVAGPIVHHGDVMPQVREPAALGQVDIAVGLGMFTLGLAKKVLLADSLAPHADMVFGYVAAGYDPPVLLAWTGLLAFFFQVYFDFSGYSDMAVGLARLFGIKLPVNFDAPYRANNMIEFWKRWHVTLSSFLQNYLYIPLGGNRKGTTRRYVNLWLTMTLGGLWHGAAWTYVAWGAINGVYLIVNHMFRTLMGGEARGRGAAVAGRVLTLLTAMWSYVYFRSDTIEVAHTIQAAMLGITPAGAGEVDSTVVWMLLGSFALSQLAPTSQRWMEAYEPVLRQHLDTLRWPDRFMWKPTMAWGVALGLLFAVCVPFLERAQQFIYWAF